MHDCVRQAKLLMSSWMFVSTKQMDWRITSTDNPFTKQPQNIFSLVGFSLNDWLISEHLLRSHIWRVTSRPTMRTDFVINVTDVPSHSQPLIILKYISTFMMISEILLVSIVPAPSVLKRYQRKIVLFCGLANLYNYRGIYWCLHVSFQGVWF